MDRDRGASRLPIRSPTKPKPLHIRKQLSEAHIAQRHQHSNQDQNNQEQEVILVYKVQSSTDASDRGQSLEPHQERVSQSESAAQADKSARSSHSSNKGRYFSDTSARVQSASTARSTVSSFKQSYMSDTSPEIMGDFVPINPLNMVSRPATANSDDAIYHR
jgi:hypothetical protein